MAQKERPRLLTKMMKLLALYLVMLMDVTLAQSVVTRVPMKSFGFGSNADLKKCKIDIGDFAIAMACDPAYNVFDRDVFLKLPVSAPSSFVSELYVADIKAVLTDGRSQPYFTYVDRNSDVNFREIIKVRAFGTVASMNRGEEQSVRQGAMISSINKDTRFYDFWLGDALGRSAAKGDEPVAVDDDHPICKSKDYICQQVNVQLAGKPLIADAFQDDLVRVIVTKDVGTRVAWTNRILIYSKMQKHSKDYA